jgi:predicted nicotinamide N-methyase
MIGMAGWPVKTYCGIKSLCPPDSSVPRDVVPGVYEGGFQLWECSLDLLKFLESVALVGCSVVELGCGRGLPGIFAALHGATSVAFQDFNPDVIEQLTKPNVELNGCDPTRCSFAAIAWQNVPAEMAAAQFDIVLAAETIYRKEQIGCFLAACRHLVRPGGCVIVAAKRMYFGLSGSVFDLIELAKKDFEYEMHEVKDQAAYRRDVIVMRPKQN